MLFLSSRRGRVHGTFWHIGCMITCGSWPSPNHDAIPPSSGDSLRCHQAISYYYHSVRDTCHGISLACISMEDWCIVHIHTLVQNHSKSWYHNITFPCFPHYPSYPPKISQVSSNFLFIVCFHSDKSLIIPIGLKKSCIEFSWIPGTPAFTLFIL